METWSLRFYIRTKHNLYYEGGDFIMTIGIMFVIVGIIIIITDKKKMKSESLRWLFLFAQNLQVLLWRNG